MIKIVRGPIQAVLEKHMLPQTGVQRPQMEEARPEEEDGLDALLAGII